MNSLSKTIQFITKTVRLNVSGFLRRIRLNNITCISQKLYMTLKSNFKVKFRFILRFVYYDIILNEHIDPIHSSTKSFKKSACLEKDQNPEKSSA